MDTRTVQPDTRFEILAESAPDAIVTIDASSTILYANAAVTRIFGYDRDELVGQPLHLLIPPRLRDQHDRGLQRYLETGEKHVPWSGVSYQVTAKDGREIQIEVAFSELPAENGEREFAGFIRDVSDRARAARALEAAKNDAEDALRELRQVTRVIDAAAGRHSYDDMLRELLHRLRQELRADEATVLLLDPEEQHLVVLAIDDAGGTVPDDGVAVPVGVGVAGTVAATKQAWVIPDMDAVTFASARLSRLGSLVVAPVILEDDVVGVLHVGSTRKNHFSSDDIRLVTVVAQRIAGALTRTRIYHEVRELRERAEHAVRQRDEVLSIVSHDLRNPLNTIGMAASLLRDDAIPLDDAQREMQLDIIGRAAKRMNRMIEDLLDISRIERGHLSVKCRCEDPEPILRDVCQAFDEVARAKSLTLSCHTEPDLPPVFADRERLVQALGNFVSNAVKFTPAGGAVTLRAERASAGGVRFSVSDTGPGIAPDDLEHVFERFWQSRSTAHMGTGLGLGIARGIAEAHHGAVRAESEVGRGSTFFLELPFAAQCATE